MLNERGAIEQKGFWSRVMYGLKELPTKPTDIVAYFERKATFSVDFLRQTEDAAWADAERDLRHQEGMALRVMDAIPSLDNNSNFTTEKIKEWSEQAEQSLRIAEAGLALCEAHSKPQ